MPDVKLCLLDLILCRHAGMPALDEIKKAQLYVRHAGMPAPDKNKKAKLYVRHAGAGQDSYDMTDEIQRA